MKPDDRKVELFEHALDISSSTGYMQLTRKAIADRSQVSEGLVTHYFGTMENLRRDIMRAAIKRELLPILAQGLAMRDKHALKAPAELQKKAATSISN